MSLGAVMLKFLEKLVVRMLLQLQWKASKRESCSCPRPSREDWYV